MLRTAIVGGSGYTGVELLRILQGHPEVEVVSVTSRKYEGRPVVDVFPSLHGYEGLEFTTPDLEDICSSADLVFTAVPHQTAMSVVPEILSSGIRVVDLSADFRLRDHKTYEEWYQPHSAPEHLAHAAYGLPEVYRQDIARARLVANPGCYPTSAILPLIPLIKKGMVTTDGIVIDSKSGASGAGRSPSMGSLFCEVNEGFMAYKVGVHRHTPEIEQELSAAADHRLVINFTPHLVPMTRGILTTVYAGLTGDFTTSEILEAIRSFHRTSPFVRVRPEGSFPNVSHVRGSNYCDIGAKVDMRTRKAVLVSALDNLVKGASGQAVQNLNIMHGFGEATGLETVPLYP